MTVFRKNFILRRLHWAICSCFRVYMELMASSLQNSEGNNYAVFNADGIPVYKSNTEIFTMIYEGDLCIGEIKGDSIQVSDAKKNQYITTCEKYRK